MMFFILITYVYSYGLPSNKTCTVTTCTSVHRTHTELVLTWMAAIGIHAESCLL